MQPWEMLPFIGLTDKKWASKGGREIGTRELDEDRILCTKCKMGVGEWVLKKE